jgi:predicted short-subunit dehydrogenase-like oxidoreductase (DUF2520 family)
LSIGIAGAGRLAQALGRQLQERGQPITAIASRSPDHARIAASFIGGDVQPVPFDQLHCDRILIAVPDSAIVEVAQRLPPSVTVALHTCGAHGADLLNPLRDRGVSCGSLHPLQTFAAPEAGYRALPGIFFAIDGGGDAFAWAREIVSLLNGSVLRIPADARALYHAAAAMAGNHLIAMIDAAVQTMRKAGPTESTALLALAPIMRASLENALAIGPTQALTGPVQRGDLATIAAHLHALEHVAPAIQNLYRGL